MEGALYAKLGHILLPNISLTPVMCLTSETHVTCVWLPDAICQLLNGVPLDSGWDSLCI